MTPLSEQDLYGRDLFDFHHRLLGVRLSIGDQEANTIQRTGHLSQ